MTPILAYFPSFTECFPDLQTAVEELRKDLLPIAAVLMIASLIGVAKEGGAQGIWRHIVFLSILCGLAANWNDWFKHAADAVTGTFTGEKYDIAIQADHYLENLTYKVEQKDDSLSYLEAFFRAVMAAGLLFLGLAAKGVIILFLFLQQILLNFAYALSPLFIGLFSLRSTRGIGLNYVMGAVGIITWPLGFALSAVGTKGLVDFFYNQGMFSAQANIMAMNGTFFALLVTGVWILTSISIAPVIISKVVTTGAQAGSALLANAINVPMAIAGGAASARTAAASSGTSAAGQSAASVLGGIAAGAGAAMQGGAAPISGQSVAALMGGNNPSPFRSSQPSAKSPSGGSKTEGDDARSSDDATPAAGGKAPSGSEPGDASAPPNMLRPQTPNNPSPATPASPMTEGSGSKGNSGARASTPAPGKSLTMDDEVNRIVRADFGNSAVSSHPEDHE
jgi:hypothetical protein